MRKLIIVSNLFILLALIGIFVFFYSDFVPDSNSLKTISVFSVDACGTGANVRDVVDQLKIDNPQLIYENHNVDDAELVHKYGITVHPTVLFLGKNGKELARLEKETDYDKYKELVEKFKDKKTSSASQPSTNTSEQTQVPTNLYFWDTQAHQYVKVAHTMQFTTSVTYPKIKAVQDLLNYNQELPNGVTNPIPKDISLERLTGIGDTTIVVLSNNFESIAQTDEGKHTIEQIRLSLKEFKGVDKVQIVSGNFKSE